MYTLIHEYATSIRIGLKQNVPKESKSKNSMEEIKERIEKEKIGLELRLFIVSNLPVLDETELHYVTFLMEEIIKTKNHSSQLYR